MPRLEYNVPCPYCGAEAGRACFQRSHFQRTGAVKWIRVHSQRLAAYRASVKSPAPVDTISTNKTLQPAGTVVQSLIALRDELLRSGPERIPRLHTLWKINSCLYKKYPSYEKPPRE